MKSNFKYYRLKNGIIVLENHIVKDGMVTLLFNGFGLLDDVRNNSIGINHMLEHIYASHDHKIYDSNAYTNFHNMGFTLNKKQSTNKTNNTIELIKILSDKFSNNKSIKNTNLTKLANELENEYYFRTTFDRFNNIYKANTSNDLYLGGRILSFKNKDVEKLLLERYDEMLFANNIAFIIGDVITPKMIAELNKFFGKLPSMEVNIKNGSKVNANFVYTNNDYLYLSFNLPYTINSYISSFYFNNYISRSMGLRNLYFDLSTDGYNFIYTIYNFYSYEQMYTLLKMISNRSYFTNLSKYDISNYYYLFQYDNTFFNRTYELAIPLFKNNVDLLYDFYSSEINIMPYVKSTIPYFYTLNDLYIVGGYNPLMMNKQDINNISYEKFLITLDFDINNNITYANKDTNNISYLYLKNREINLHKKTKWLNNNKNNITIKYNYNLKNYVLHNIFRLFMNIMKGDYLNSIIINMDNYNDLSDFIYILSNEFDFDCMKSIMKKNELLFTMNIITNYALYDNIFKPNEVIDFINKNNNNINIQPYEINLNTTHKKELENAIESLSLETKGYDMKINIKKIKNDTIKIKTKFNFFIYVTDAKLNYDEVIWSMKERGLLYTLVYNTLGDYTVIRAPSIFPEECVKYLKEMSNKNIKYAIISVATKGEIMNINID